MDYNYSLEEFKTFWSQNPIVVFDTNAILHLYRMSSKTTEDILKNLQNIPKHQIWLPHQVIVEYKRNKDDSRKSEFHKYKGVHKDINGIIEQTQSKVSKKFDYYGKLNFPKIEELRNETFKLLSEIKDNTKKYVLDIEDEIELNNKILKEDKIDQFVKELIQHRCIGNAYTVPELLNVYREGEERYKYLIPPGYEDMDKDKNDPTKTHKYGDLLVWKQLIDKAAIDNKAIIFVTNDDKKDWWVKENDVLIKPREELYEEFNMSTSQEIEIMNLTNFYRVFAKTYNVFSNRTAIEMDSKDICNEIIKGFEWSSIIDKDGELTYSFIHDGDFQCYIENVLSDVEVVEYGFPFIEEIIDFNIDEEDCVRIKAQFSNFLQTIITESYSSSYEEINDFEVKINGTIIFEFEISESNESLVKSENQKVYIDSWDITEVKKDVVDPSDICFVCNKKDAVYYTDARDGLCKSCSMNYEPCPKCGIFYRKGELHGSFCYKCEMAST
ncbi:PIN-like domain-containing protein [Bacillus atrophaeus]|uniref:PIN-like domain-containing protein n=1 Tax=Bacillus atrophaeus TaxID=1452 RepID=UPI0022805729|nr:PIN-like domain-containing protein [Bacillus atrophaeus]MCY8810674.1 PIN-like domain-containing protein [Bacillus atrophaeus]MCY8907826.1 PIN-like domain-containing protein [Bacillus atrophaeus]MEC0837832.1 PIN-like domain-containing protein [Bacillus atrophaeus]MEC0847733.1 PIN-like domain-containing protein [Bacillus atrophaeus]MEC0849952.1 PIN-like domain-containing protein [Bacillus atrophaeus]